jgi:ankyrin repeat protein
VKKALAPEIINFKHPYSHDTPLHCATASPFPKRKSVVETLCRKGANLNDKNKEFLTPLHVAAEKSHYDVSSNLFCPRVGSRKEIIVSHKQKTINNNEITQWKPKFY